MNDNFKVSDDLRKMMTNEQVIWSGRPKKICFFLECVFNPMLIFAAIWFVFDFTFIGSVFSDGIDFSDSSNLAILGFFALHLMPVWFYLGGVLFSFRKLRHTEFVITKNGIYVTGGMFTKQYSFKPFYDIVSVNVKRGFFDSMLGVGDVYVYCSEACTTNRNTSSFYIMDISDYQQVANLIERCLAEEHDRIRRNNNASYYHNNQNPQQVINAAFQTVFNSKRNTQQPPSYNPQTPPQQNPTYNSQSNQPQQTYQNQNYNHPYNTADYSSNPDFTGENCDTHNGYEVNYGNYDYDSWDAPNLKKEKDIWED